MERYERVGAVDFKGAKDIVTEVDHLSEALILDAIRDRYPGDALLAEETGQHAGESIGATAGAGRTWIVDPIDGTINYANGIPFFCVSIALVQDGRPIVGVIHDPTRQETFVAQAGSRTTLAGRPVSASGKARLEDCVVSLSLSGRSVVRRLRAVRKAVRVSRSMGSAALALAYVSCGRFDAFVQQGGLSLWDIAAAGLIAEGGGARVTDLGGGSWFRLADAPKSIGLVAAPASLQPAFLSLVHGEG
jgi:myo-inositol-1(or 4)-monophosphatase